MPDESLVGRVVGDYEILREIGRGGMGVVYAAQERALQRVVALKVLPSNISADIAFVKRFEREARFAASLSHPHIVAIYAVGKFEDVRYIAMEFINGKTLTSLIREAGRLSVARALEITLQVADALGAAHRVNMVHRDIKPDNIMIDETGRAKVMDFGLARGVHSTTQLTAEGAVIGTPRYMSPEQCEGQKPDQRTDLYSLGIVLFEMLTGRSPYVADTPLALMRQIVDTPMPALNELSADVPPQVCAIAAKLTAKRRGDRYDSAETLCEDIRAYIDIARPPSQSVSVPQERATEVLPSGVSAEPTPLISAQDVPTPVTPAIGSNIPTPVSVPASQGGEPIPVPTPLMTPAPILTPTPSPMPEIVATPTPSGVMHPPARPHAIHYFLAVAAAIVLVLAGVVLALVLRPDREEGTQEKPVQTVNANDPTVAIEVAPPVNVAPTSPVTTPPVIIAPPVTVAPPATQVSPRGTELPANAPHKLVFDTPEIVLDPVNTSAEVVFRVDPETAGLEGVSWYAGGPLLVWPRERSVLIRAANIEVGLGEEAVYKVIARVEQPGVDVGEIQVRIRNPIELLKFAFTPNNVALDAQHPEAKVDFELRSATGQTIPSGTITFQLYPGNAPIQVTRDGENALRINLMTTAQSDREIVAGLRALVKDAVLGELPLRIAPVCAVRSVVFASPTVLLTNAQRSAQVYFDTQPGGLSDAALADMSFQPDDARVAVKRISRNVIEVSLAEGVTLENLAVEGHAVTGFQCGRAVGTLRVELLSQVFTPRVTFPGGKPSISNTARSVDVTFDVEPAGVPPEVLEDIGFQADGFDIAVTRKGPRELTIALRQSANVTGDTAQTRAVSAWFEGQMVGAIEVELAPASNAPRIVFLAENVRLTNTERHATVDFDIAPPEASAGILDALRFRTDASDVIVNRKGQRQIEVVLSPFVRLKTGERREVTVSARDTAAVSGELKVQIVGPAAIDHVEVHPERVFLTPTNPSAYVSLTVFPGDAPADEVQRIECALDGNAAGITWKRTRTGEVTVSMNESSFGLGEERDAALLLRAQGIVVGRLDIHASRPHGTQEVRFVPENLRLSGSQTEARVGYMPVPEDTAAGRIEWDADAGLTVRDLGNRMLQVSYTPETGEGTGPADRNVRAKLDGSIIGALPVRIEGISAPAAAATPDAVSPQPSPDAVRFSYPKTVKVGQTAQIQVDAANWLRTDEIGTLVLSIDGCAPQTEEASDGSYNVWSAGGRPVARFYQDGSVWRRQAEKVPPQSLIVEKYVPVWPAGERQILRFPLTFTAAGTATLYLRVTFARRDASDIILHTNLPDSGTNDQQGVPCLSFPVEVTP